MTDDSSATWTQTRAKIASYRRHNPDAEPPRELYRDHAAARLRDYVSRTVDQFPEMTDDQRARVAALLRPTAGERPSGGDAA